MNVANIIANHSLTTPVPQILKNLQPLIIVDQIISIIQHFLLVLTKLKYLNQSIKPII